ncbi:YisL family protein [Salinicoccus sp. HZC-1]|uniref:YisL family protein n=1 Tax=Salinicoccus sp. HZC-1 TaxID=3385497 RepID=UPI00398B76AC
MIHLHITAIIIALVFFFITYFSIKNPGDSTAKYAKAPHMVARLFYVIVLATGFMLFMESMSGDQAMMYGFKFLAGLFTIGLMEMAVVRKRKKSAGQPMFIVFLVLAVITIGLGIYLPMGPITGLFR